MAMPGHILTLATASRIPLPDRSVHCVVTSPPYYQKRRYDGPHEFVGGCDSVAACREHEWVECGVVAGSAQNPGLTGVVQKRILAESSRKGQPLGRVCVACGQWRGQLGWEPKVEMFVENVAKVFREVYRVLRDDGTLWLNIGDTYHDKRLLGIPWRVALRMQDDGWILRSECIWNKTNGMPSSQTDRPSGKHEHVFMFTKSKQYYYDHVGVRVAGKPKSVERYKFAFGGMKQGALREQGDRLRIVGRRQTDGRRALGTVWSLGVARSREDHFAVFPESIPEIAIKAATSEFGCCRDCGGPYRRIVESRRVATRPGCGSKVHGYDRDSVGNRDPRRHLTEYSTVGWEKSCRCKTAEVSRCVVLDTFSGMGTTLAVASRLGRDSVGLDLSPKYAAVANRGLNRPHSRKKKGGLREVRDAEATDQLFAT